MHRKHRATIAPQLPPNPTSLYRHLWGLYIPWSFSRHFAALHVRGHVSPSDRGTLFFSNHSNWWDGFAAWLICTRWLELQTFAPMQIENLQKTPSMTSLGAFALDRSNPKRALEALDWVAQNHVNKAGTCMWIFPQGQLLPPEQRKMHFEGGAARLAKRHNLRLMPVALRFAYCSKQKPEVFADFGAAISTQDPRRELTRSMEAHLETLIRHQEEKLSRQDYEGYHTLLQGKPGVDERWQFSKRQK